jgi:hypothetical protein
VRRRKGERFLKECLKPAIKHGGGSVIAWGAISPYGVWPLKKIDGKMDKKYYHKILQRHAIPAGTRLIGKNFVFQEHNDPKHASTYCRDYLAKKEELGISCFFISVSDKKRLSRHRGNLKLAFLGCTCVVVHTVSIP